MKKSIAPLYFALVAFAAAAVTMPFDLKIASLDAYGVRHARATAPDTVRVVIGASVSDAAGHAESWRIFSEDDPAYGYDRFRRPTAARIVDDKVEYEHPKGFKEFAEKGRDFCPQAKTALRRVAVELTVPEALKPGCRYAVVAQGKDGMLVTAANSSVAFSGAPDASDAAEKEPDAFAARAIGLRRVSNVGDGKIVLEFGHGFNPAGGNRLQNYTVTVNGSPCPVFAMGRDSKLDLYAPVGNWGGTYNVLMKHDVFLDVTRPLADGDVVEVSVSPDVCAAVRKAKFTFHSDKSITRSIQANQIGYVPQGPKVAYLSCWMGSYPDDEASLGGTLEGFDELAGEESFSQYSKRSLGFDQAPDFSVVDAKTGKAVFTGKSRFAHDGEQNDFAVFEPLKARNLAGANVYALDFSKFRRPGTYYLRVKGIGRSISFRIGDDVYLEAFRKVASGVYAQRCGCELDPKLTGGWHRIACHTNGIVCTSVSEGAGEKHGSPFLKNVLRDDKGRAIVLHGVGGHHDAGDYNPRAHIDVAQALFDTYELAPKKFTDGQLGIPEHGNGIPDIVDEGLWALKIWETLQDEDGGVRGGTESQGDPNLMQTVDLDPCGDFAYRKDAGWSFVAAGVFAQASRILSSLGKTERAADYLSRAKRAYDWATRHSGAAVDGGEKVLSYAELLSGASEEDSATRDSATSDDAHDPAPPRLNDSSRAYAAAQLFHTTWEEAYHGDFKACCPWVGNPKAPLILWKAYDMKEAAIAYALIPVGKGKADAKLHQAVVGAFESEANQYMFASSKLAYPFIHHGYTMELWGAAAYENYLVPVWNAWRFTGRQEYFDWMVRTCDNTLGANPLGLSYIVGLGQRTIRCPLHNSRYRPAGLTMDKNGKPLPGGRPVDGLQCQGPLSDGAGYFFQASAYPEISTKKAILHNFADCHFCIGMDEGTVNNQVLTMAAFGLLCPGEIQLGSAGSDEDEDDDDFEEL